MQFSSIGAGIPDEAHDRFRGELKSIASQNPFNVYYDCRWGFEGEHTYYLKAANVDIQRSIEEIATRLSKEPPLRNRGIISVAISGCDRPNLCYSIADQNDLLVDNK